MDQCIKSLWVSWVLSTQQMLWHSQCQFTRLVSNALALVAACVSCRCLRHQEPVLLVGETGTGKTTVCQLLALMRGQRLHIINCNQHTETSDFLGGFRPTRCAAV